MKKVIRGMELSQRFVEVGNIAYYFCQSRSFLESLSQVWSGDNKGLSEQTDDYEFSILFDWLGPRSEH